jgi:hypothetical protein
MVALYASLVGFKPLSLEALLWYTQSPGFRRRVQLLQGYERSHWM